MGYVPPVPSPRSPRSPRSHIASIEALLVPFGTIIWRGCSAGLRSSRREKGYCLLLLVTSTSLSRNFTVALRATAPWDEVSKHSEWESSGWGPVGPTFVYLVFDPTDSLSVAAKNHQPGRYSGIPCEVAHIQRLESHLYAVTFYTEEIWGERNRLDCSGFG